MNFSDDIEQRDFVENIIHALPPSEQRLLRMYFFDGMTFNEIANNFGVTQNCISNFVREILKDCRRLVGILLKDKRESILQGSEVITPKSLVYCHSSYGRKKLIKKRERDKARLEFVKEGERLRKEQMIRNYKFQKTLPDSVYRGTIFVNDREFIFQCG